MDPTGRAILQVGRPSYPRSAVLLSVRSFVEDGINSYLSGVNYGKSVVLKNVEPLGIMFAY